VSARSAGESAAPGPIKAMAAAIRAGSVAGKQAPHLDSDAGDG
jgi:hypothetical protein